MTGDDTSVTTRGHLLAFLCPLSVSCWSAKLSTASRALSNSFPPSPPPLGLGGVCSILVGHTAVMDGLWMGEPAERWETDGIWTDWRTRSRPMSSAANVN